MTLKMMSIMFLASPHSATVTLTTQVGCCIVANGMLGLIKLAGRSYTNLSLHARCLTRHREPQPQQDHSPGSPSFEIESGRTPVKFFGHLCWTGANIYRPFHVFGAVDKRYGTESSNTISKLAQAHAGAKVGLPGSELQIKHIT